MARRFYFESRVGMPQVAGLRYALVITDRCKAAAFVTNNINSYTSNSADRLTNSGIMISFDDWTTTRDKSENVKGAKDPVRMVVEWQKPISKADVEAKLKRGAGDWHSAEQDYYSKLIVKDIR